MLQNYFKFVGEKNENNITVKYKLCQGDNKCVSDTWHLHKAFED